MVAFGNGQNDRLLLKSVKEVGGLAIVVENGEGCASDALINAHLLIAGAAILIVAHAGAFYVAWSHLALPAVAVFLLIALVAHKRAGVLGLLHAFFRRRLRLCDDKAD